MVSHHQTAFLSTSSRSCSSLRASVMDPPFAALPPVGSCPFAATASSTSARNGVSKYSPCTPGNIQRWKTNQRILPRLRYQPSISSSPAGTDRIDISNKNSHGDQSLYSLLQSPTPRPQGMKGQTSTRTSPPRSPLLPHYPLHWHRQLCSAAWL